LDVAKAKDDTKNDRPPLVQQDTTATTSSNDYFAAADSFCNAYQDKYCELHLLYNNCWSFALELLEELEQTCRNERMQDHGVK
jgi:hypothetical protein